MQGGIHLNAQMDILSHSENPVCAEFFVIFGGGKNVGDYRFSKRIKMS